NIMAARETIFRRPRKSTEKSDLYCPALETSAPHKTGADRRGSMITITKSMVALSALIAAGLVGVFDPTAPRAEDPAANGVVAPRSPMGRELFTPVSIAYFVSQRFIEEQQLAQQEQLQQQQVDGGKSNKLDCSQQGWPYLSRNCLVASEGS